MKPIYFPFTYVSAAAGAALAACFGRVVVYRPSAGPLPPEMQAGVQNGVLDIRMPAAGRQQKIAAAVDEFRRWADMHQDTGGARTAFLSARDELAPFFSAASTSQIVADIRKNLRPETPGGDSDALYHARVFLALAQEFDRQNQAISRSVADYEEKAARLMDQLKGRRTPPTGGGVQRSAGETYDPGRQMLSQRLAAWACLLACDQSPPGPYVTTSTAVMEYLLEGAPGAEKICHWAGVPRPGAGSEKAGKWRRDLALWLAAAVENERTEPPDFPFEMPAGLALTIYRVPAASLSAIFSPRPSEVSNLADNRPPGSRHVLLIGLAGV